MLLSFEHLAKDFFVKIKTSFQIFYLFYLIIKFNIYH